MTPLPLIEACIHNHWYAVELLDTSDYLPTKRVLVQVLPMRDWRGRLIQPKPFTQITHGGPVDLDTGYIFPRNIRVDGIHLTDYQPEPTMEKELERLR
jgi:hypothetical protein